MYRQPLDLPHSLLRDLADAVATSRWAVVDHHAAHATSGFFDSGLASALVLSFDGGGFALFFFAYLFF